MGRCRWSRAQGLGCSRRHRAHPTGLFEVYAECRSMQAHARISIVHRRRARRVSARGLRYSAPAAQRGGGGGVTAPRRQRSEGRRMPGVPGEQRVEPERVEAAGAFGFGDTRWPYQRDRRTHDAASRFRRQRCLRNSVQGRAGAPSRGDRSTTPSTATRVTRARSRFRRARRRRRLVETGDRHVLVVQQSTCHLFELYDAHLAAGAVGTRRPARTGTSRRTVPPARVGPRPTPRACPYLGRARCATTRSRPARSTTRCDSLSPQTQRGYILPATHLASSSTDPTLPAMGLRLRLNANYSLARFHGAVVVILRALKQYGMIVADNGGSWFITGAGRSTLERCRPRPAEDGSRQRVPSREHRPDPPLAESAAG